MRRHPALVVARVVVLAVARAVRVPVDTEVDLRPRCVALAPVGIEAARRLRRTASTISVIMVQMSPQPSLAPLL